MSGDVEELGPDLLEGAGALLALDREVVLRGRVLPGHVDGGTCHRHRLDIGRSGQPAATVIAATTADGERTEEPCQNEASKEGDDWCLHGDLPSFDVAVDVPA